VAVVSGEPRPDAAPTGEPRPDAAATGEPSAGPHPATGHLTILGATRRAPVEHVECFPAPAGLGLVRFDTDEVTSLCPVTGQPDISSVGIEYVPRQRCIESKSLKLYLWGFRDRAVFAEALAVEIAEEVWRSAEPERVRVELTQRPRGGITIRAVAERPHPR
jgi:7-cyano-7-deazaguanine reductase